MFPGAFEYAAPSSVADAIGLIAPDEDAKVLAGGQSLIPLMKLRFARPTLLVDIGRIAPLRRLELDTDELRIGATVRDAEVEAAAEVCRAFPILRDTSRVIADPLVRNMATVGGNLAHGDPENDQPATMIALDATVVVEGPSGERVVPAGEFYLGLYYTALEPDEILTQIRVPTLPDRSGTAYLKVHRQVGDFAIAGVAARVDLDGDLVRDARLVFTGVGTTPGRVTDAEETLKGSPLTDESMATAGDIVATALDVRDDRAGSAAYKRRVLATITRRALALAGRRATGSYENCGNGRGSA